VPEAVIETEDLTVTYGPELRRRVGYLPGELRLYPGMRARQYLDLLGSLHGKQVDRQYRHELCERVGIIRDGRLVKTERVETLVRQQFKRLHLTLRESPSAETFAIEGVRELGREGATVRLEIRQNLERVMAAAAAFGIVDYLPNRRIAALVTTVIFLASYFGEMVTGFVQSLEAIRPLPLFYYFDSSAELFTQGVRTRDLVVLFSLAALFYALALWSFERRDITVGAWPWRRARAQVGTAEEDG